MKQRAKLVIDDSPTANYDVQKLIKNNIGVTNAIASNEMKPRCSVLAKSWMRSKHASNYFLGTKKKFAFKVVYLKKKIGRLERAPLLTIKFI